VRSFRPGQRRLALSSRMRTARSASPSLNLTQKGFSTGMRRRKAAATIFGQGDVI